MREWFTRVFSRRGERSSGAVFGVACGFLLGVLVTALIVPRKQTVTVYGSSQAPGAVAGAATGPGVSGPAAGAGAGIPGTESPVGGTAGPSGSTAAVTGGGPSPTVGAATGGSGAAQVGPAAQGAAPGPGGSVVGVTDKTIKIGIGVPDLAGLNAAGSNYDWGDPQLEFEAAVALIRHKKLVPINGRDLQFVYSRYDITSASAERQSCVDLAQDQKVFAAANTDIGTLLAECIAGEFRTPMIQVDSSGITDQDYRSFPDLFTVEMSDTRELRNWAYWADSLGLLKGKKIGIYSYSEDQQVLNQNLVPQLTKLGYRVTAWALVGDNPGPQDAVAVQQFRNAGVNLVFPYLSALNQTAFMQTAQSQLYKPTYIESDFANNSGDAGASTFSPDQFDGSYAMAGQPSGSKSRPNPADVEECVGNYVNYAHDKRPAQDSLKWNNILMSCDIANLLVAGLRAAGPNLTRDAYVAGLESLKNFHLMYVPAVTYAPGKHAGNDQLHTAQWHRDCACYRWAQNYRPAWMP